MAEEKLGTLQYDMLVDQKKLEQQLEDITKKLQEKDKQWKEILSGQGNVVSPKINVADLGNLTKANEAIANSTKNVTKANADVATSMALLEKEIKAETLALKELSDQELKSTTNQAKLAELQKKIDLYAQFKESLNEEVKARKAQESADKRKADSDEREIKRLQKLTEAQQLYRSKLTSTVANTAIGTAENIAAQKAVLKYDLRTTEDPAEIARLTKAIKENDIARKNLIKTQKEQQASARSLWQEQKLKLAVDQQAAGSIEKLRAQYALLKFQLSQVKFSDPNAVANVQRLQTAISGVKSEIQALQPTLGIWGKLTSAIRTYATAYLSVQAVLGLGRAVYGQTKELDSLNFSMKTVIKSSTELAQTQKFLSDVAVNYGGDLLTLSERYVKFRAAALQSNMSAGETQKIYESVSKAAGTLGLKTDELSGVYLALEQMISKGKVSTEELRRQLGERLPGAFGIMANALGKTVPELDKMLKKGEVLSSEALPKFAAALEKAYGIESLKKIDTLAAAQGRMSTEFTGLIKAMSASDTFKNTINAMASFIGFVKDNIGVIGLFAKSIAVVTLAVVANRIATTIFVGVQKLSVILTGSQIAKMTQLTAAQLASAEATWVNVRATSALSNTFKTFGGWISIVVNALVGIAAYFLIFNKQTKETADAMAQLNKEIGNQKDIVYNANKVLSNAKVGTEQYKEALQQLNTIALKYNQTLLTEKNTRAEVNSSAAQTLRNLDLEYLKKKKVIELEGANTAVAASVDPLQEKLFELYQNLPGGAEKAVLAYKEFVQQMKDGEDGFSSLSERIRKEFGTTADVAIRPLIKDALNGLLIFEKEIARIKANYPADKVAEKLFDVAEIEKAKKAFEEFQKLKSQGAANLYSGGFVGSDAQTFEDWLRNQIKSLSTSTAEIEKNKDALTALYIALADVEKKQQPSEDRSKKLAADRNEAIRKLNDKYLADQEDFANYEMGIASGRIAAMEDGIEKEQKLNELAYANRLKAIEKEKIKTLELLNVARDPKTKEITGLSAVGYDDKTQQAIIDARNADAQKRLDNENTLREANLKSEKDYQIKINEIRRDANDQFLSGLEKERAAINEKYDEWVRKAGTNMKLIAEIEKGRDVALSEIYIQNQIDQLDFAREIEYKKNEIALFGSANRRKLDKANFDTYASFERQRIKLLKSSESVDKQKEGLTAEQKLKQDEILQGLTEEEQLRNDILKAAALLSDILATNLGLSEAQAKQINIAISSLQNIASGDYISAAAGLLSSILDKQSALDFSNLEDKLAKPWEEFEKWLAASNRGLQQYIKLRDEAVGVDKYSASTMVIEEQQRKLTEYQKKLDSLSFNLKVSGEGWFNKPYTEIDNQLKDLQEKLGGLFNQEGKLKEWGVGFWKSVSGVFSFDLSQILYDNLGQFDITKINELINQGLITDESVIKAVDDYITLKDAIKEAEAAKKELLTATMADTLAQSLTDGFKNGLSSAADFADTFEGFIRGAIDNALKILSEPDFKKWYTDFAAAMESEGMLTSDEIAGLRESWNAIIERQKANRDAVYAISGLPSVASESTGTSISKGIQALTEDTGRRLEGLINSIRESGVINIGNTKQLVESSQMIQGYAAQSLGHLRNIDMTTSEQLKLLNSVVFNGHSKGGAGIKTFTD